MAVYSDTDFRKDKRLKFRPLLKEPGPCSQDLHIGRLFEQGKKWQDIGLPWKTYRRGLKRISTFRQNGEDVWILKPGYLYLAETVERLTLPGGLTVDVDTRSSWARYGVRVQHVDDRLDRGGGYDGHIPLAITSCDKPVILRPNDRICQAIVYDGGRDILMNNQIHEALKSGKIECYRRAEFDSKVKLPSWMIRNESLGFTLHPIIKKFDGREIDPKKDMSANYSTFDITGGLNIPYNWFFISSSNETVVMGRMYAGMLRELFTAPERIRMHANAGYLNPGSNGMITFEQHLVPAGSKALYPDMRMGEMEILRLKTPCTEKYDSKYNGQFEPSASKGHLDYRRE